LLVSTAARWYGAERMPRALAKAGFEVSLLTPRRSLAEASRYVRRVAYFADHTTTLDWIQALAGTVRAVSPALIVPCDDVTFRLLATLVVAPPPRLQPALQSELAALIRASLGDPTHYRASVDKTRLTDAATRADVRVPPHAVITSSDDGEAFAAEHRYPVIVKRPYTSAGDGVRIAASAAELRDAIASLRVPDDNDFEPDSSGRLLVQKYVDGYSCYHETAAWEGRVLAGYAGDRLQTYAGVTSPATVVRYRHAPEVRAMSERLVAAFGMSGLFTTECVIEHGTGTPFLIDVERRIGPATHHGTVINVDLCAALAAAMRDSPSPSRAGLDLGEERVFVHFPGEWLRDPQSKWLRQHPVDMPWDDPELLDAMLALPQKRPT
jgi:predicted ATP-grasp superfamily ATP-dependent carboligase